MQPHADRVPPVSRIEFEREDAVATLQSNHAVVREVHDVALFSWAGIACHRRVKRPSY